MGQPTGQRNHFGVKNSSDCWRTIGDVRWQVWAVQPSDAAVAIYKAHGVRCRDVKRRDGSRDLFVHPDDHAKAELAEREVDARLAEKWADPA